MHTCVRCPRPLSACSAVCAHGVFCVFRVRCPEPLGSCPPLCPLVALCCVCEVLGRLAPVHRCACSVRCVGCAVSWATLLLFTGVLTRCVVLLVTYPGPLGSCSPVCRFGALCCVCGVLGHLAPVHRCACPVCCVACAVSWATWLLFTGVPARCVVLCVRCPGPLGSCSQVSPFVVLFCMCGVLGHLAPVHRCARSACCVVCAVSWAISGLRFSGIRLTVLDAFWGATWSGQVITSPPGPSGGPFMTHLLPGGGVPRVPGVRALSLPDVPISPLPGQCVA